MFPFACHGRIATLLNYQLHQDFNACSCSNPRRDPFSFQFRSWCSWCTLAFFVFGVLCIVFVCFVDERSTKTCAPTTALVIVISSWLCTFSRVWFGHLTVGRVFILVWQLVQIKSSLNFQLRACEVLQMVSEVGYQSLVVTCKWLVTRMVNLIRCFCCLFST